MGPTTMGPAPAEMADRWTGGDEYEEFIGRWSRPVADQFLDRLSVPAGRQWIEVGCGTRGLSSQILERCATASLVGVDPSPEFTSHASATIVDDRARFVVGSAVALPIESGTAHAIVAGLVLNFIPDLAAALREMIRVGVGGAPGRGLRLGLRRQNAAVASLLGRRDRAGSSDG